MSMIGKSLAHYEITAEIGKGGMGEVYLAKDQKLGRDVAIKVLPDEFAKDDDRVARFQREAKLLASLNHPNIAAIHGLEESNGTHFLVMELIEGDTLADRIKTGPIPVEEALKLALQIAEALESAHENGVIHRDLKPANIKVTPDGKVKVLDFGLAKAYAEDPENINLSNSPTLSDAATQQGVILGTAAYMSPDQARGKPVDRRADVWAFGAVLYELLTSKAAFLGKDVTDTLAAVIRSEPDWENLPANLHGRLREVLERCLEKEARDRYSGINDARVDIQKVLTDPSGVLVKPFAIMKHRKKLRLGVPWITGIAVLCIIIAGAVVWKLKPTEPRRVIRLDYVLPENQQFSNLMLYALAVSPDGTQFVYSTTKGLYLRSENEMDAKLIVGTDENPVNPFFSPNGQWIGYFSTVGQPAKLKKIGVGGGAAVALCDVPGLPVGASWDTDDMIIYGQYPGPIMKISAAGGTPDPLVEAEGVLYAPQILPDGETLIYSQLASNIAQVVVESLETGERKELFPGHTARYLPTGHIVYAVGNNLLAVPFDLGSLEVIGGGIPLVEGILLNANGQALHYAISDSGTLVYRPGQAMAGTGERTLVWVDREGQEEPIKASSNDYQYPKISPDGTRVALKTSISGNADIWIWDLVRENLTRLTFDEGNDIQPIWTPDGQWIVFTSEGGISWKKADGTGETELLASAPDRALFPFSWSSDGKILVMGETQDSVTLFDIGMLSIEGDRTRKPLLQEDYTEVQPQISPDGRWIAYASSESGQQNEVYVRAFPDVDSGGRWQVSVSGGSSPLWSPDGRELFYLIGGTIAEAVMAVSVETAPTFKYGSPKTLFSGKYVGPLPADGTPYDISPDGKRFLMLKQTASESDESEAEAPKKINIVLNWFEELKDRVPTD